MDVRGSVLCYTMPRACLSSSERQAVARIMLQAHCAANDTAGNEMVDLVSTFLSPPRIIDPYCIARRSCLTGEVIASLTFSTTVSGRLAYVLLPEGAFNGTLTTDEVFAEAATPTLLRPFMLSNTEVDSSHHGVLDITQPALSTQAPITLQSGVSYQLLMAAKFDDAEVPCCFDSTLEAPVSILINDTLCRDPDCCHPTDTLRELQPELTFSDGFGVPVGQMQGRALDDFTYAFEQTFALLGILPGETGTVVARAGGSQLYTQAGSGRQATTLEVDALRRSPVSARMVAQQSTLYNEMSLGTEETSGRALYVR